MRKLKLQMQMTLDGYVARANGDLDWMWLPSTPDESFAQQIIDIAAASDTLLLGRKMTREFIDHWENIVDHHPNSPEYSLALLMVNLRKVVFSRTTTEVNGRNLTVENGDLVTAVRALKEKPGKDLLVYGGANFVSSLIAENLIDEYIIFTNPVAISNGLSIFNQQKMFVLESSKAFKNGKIMNKYLPV